MKKSNSIIVKIPLIVNIIIVLLSFSIIFTTVRMSIKAINNATYSGFITSVNGYSTLLDTIIEDQLIIMDAYSRVPTIIEYMQTRSEYIRDEAIRTMINLFDNNDYIVSLDLIGLDGKVIESYNGDTKNQGLDMSVAYPNMWQEYIDSGYDHASSDSIYKSDINKGFVLPIVHSIYNLENKLIGSFIAFIDWTKIINDSLENSRNELSADKSIFVLNEYSEYVYHNIDSLLGTKADSSLIIPKQNSGLLKYTDNNAPRTAFFKSMESQPWYMVSSITYKLLHAQSNINASVEAARAGDQGKGFAVVASEVRNLAQNSQASAKDITLLIEDIYEKINKSAQMARHSQEIFTDIESKIEETSKIMNDISHTAVEQETGVDQVNSAVSKMDNITQQNASLVEQSAAASKSLLDQANHLEHLMSFFKVE